MQSGNTVHVLPYPAFSITRYAAMATEVTKEAAVPPEETIKPAPQASTEAEEVTTAPQAEVTEVADNAPNVISFESFRALNDNVTFSNYDAESDGGNDFEDSIQFTLMNLDEPTEPTIDIII